MRKFRQGDYDGWLLLFYVIAFVITCLDYHHWHYHETFTVVTIPLMVVFIVIYFFRFCNSKW